MIAQHIYKHFLNKQVKSINENLSSIISSTSTSAQIESMLKEATSRGKRFRPLLMFLINDHLGGNWRDILKLGSAVELLHKASLVHDDLVDGDHFRRGFPSFWSKYGKRKAVIVGDILIGLSFSAVSDWTLANVDNNYQEILDLFNHILKSAAIGELMDIEFESATTVDHVAVEQMTLLKSAVFIANSMRIGAVAGGASEQVCNTICDLGYRIGYIFQIINDINNIIGLDMNSKKSIGQDLSLNKKNVATIPLLNAGVKVHEINRISECEIRHILSPAFSELNKQIESAYQLIPYIPSNKLRFVFKSLLKDSQNQWYWSGNN